MRRRVDVFCLEWHIRSSLAFQEILIDPLRSVAEVSLHQWNRTPASIGDVVDLGAAGPVVFCQAPPPLELADQGGTRVVWVPMWDEIRTYHDDIWASLPRTIHVVAFSRAVAARTTAMGFPTLEVQYFLDPSRLQRASFSDGCMLYYWNRTGLFSPRFLARLCLSLKAKTLLFRRQIDPGVSRRAAFRLPPRLGGATIREVPAVLPRDEYLRVVSSANVFLAPRACEGVGLMLLEATARGQAVLACDAPAMNEYITHAEDGVLLRLASSPDEVDRPWKWFNWLGPRKPIDRPNADLAPAIDQDWEMIAGLDLAALGQRARERHQDGFGKWSTRVRDLTSFVLDG